MGASVIKVIRQQPAGVSIPAAIHGGPGVLTPAQSIYVASSVQKHPLEARLQVGSRVFYYAQANASTALLAGKLVQSAALGGSGTTAQTHCPISVASLSGDTRIFLTAVTTAQLANIYADGLAMIEDNSLGDYYTFRVKGNSALAITGVTGYVDLYDGVPVALTTSDFADLIVNPYKLVVIDNYSTPTGAVLGAPIIPVPVSNYFWLQTYGPIAVYSSAAALTLGTAVMKSEAADGSVGVCGANTVTNEVGIALEAGTSGKAVLIHMTIRF